MICVFAQKLLQRLLLGAKTLGCIKHSKFAFEKVREAKMIIVITSVLNVDGPRWKVPSGD